MATKRKRTKELKSTVSPATDASKPEASGRIAPRKRTDVPVKTARAASVSRSKNGESPVADVPRERARSSSSRDNLGEAKAKPRKRRWPLIVAGTVLGLVLLVAGLFSWDRWLRYDDAAEFQGEWQTHGTAAVVVIDGETIKLSDDVAYSYTLDTSAKTIAFTFGNMEGSGRYRFSLDRSQLVITDGKGYSWFSTLADDVAWQFDQLVRAVQGKPQVDPPSGEEITVLDRLSHDSAAAPQTGSSAAVEPEPEVETQTEPNTPTEPETAPESAPDSAESNPEAVQDDVSDDAKANADENDADPTAPSNVFDVNDIPA